MFNPFKRPRPSASSADIESAMYELRRTSRDWITLPCKRTGPTPEWPFNREANPEEWRHWERVWTTPQATQWERHGLEMAVALYVSILADAEIPHAAAANVRNFMRQMQDELGLSLAGMQRFRWRIADA